MKQEEASWSTIKEICEVNTFDYLRVESSEQTILENDDMPTQLNVGGLFICQQGSTEVVLDMKKYIIQEGDLCVCFPFTIIQVKNKSKDFKGLVMTMNMDLVMNIQLPSTTPYYLFIKENPCISLSEEEQGRLLELCDLVIQKDSHKEHIFHKEIVESLLMVVCYEIAAIYTKRKPIPQQKSSQKDIVFQKFLFSLTRNYKTHREVEFYAQESFITPRYFSSIIKELSGTSASQWIARIVIIQAKNLLTTSKMSIQEVSNELNFANPSFFGQYFKKHTGVTPKIYQSKLELDIKE